MNTALKQANFQIPEDLLNELRTTVGKSELSKFVSQALKRELQSLRQQTAIDETFGIWKNQEHPELTKGINDFVRTLRKSTRGKRADAANRR